jgi:hypothetical protein
LVTTTRQSLGNVVQVTDRVQADLGNFMHGGTEIGLYDGPLTAWINRIGDFRLSMDSRIIATRYMQWDERLTAQVREHFRNYGRRTTPENKPSLQTYLENWVNVHPYKSFGKPDAYPEGRKDWSTGAYEGGNTLNFGEDCWLGDPFIYTHFDTGVGEGAIIMWHKGGDLRGNYGDPEVWIGDFEGFMQEQSWCEWFSSEGFEMWNDNLGGAFMWALNELGSFKGDVELSSVIYEAIENNPELAFDPVDIGVLRNERAFPPEVVKAVRDYMENRGRR